MDFKGILSRGTGGTPLGSAGMILFIKNTRGVIVGLQGVDESCQGGPQGLESAGMILHIRNTRVTSRRGGPQGLH